MELIKSKLVYIMDKSYDNLKIYEDIFLRQYKKYETKFFTHCSDLEQNVKQNIPDIVIIDGDSDYGMITANKIRLVSKSIKIIISATTDKLALEALRIGFFGFLIKPIEEGKIKEIMKKV